MESVNSICRDSADTQCMRIQKNLSNLKNGKGYNNIVLMTNKTPSENFTGDILKFDWYFQLSGSRSNTKHPKSVFFIFFFLQMA